MTSRYIIFRRLETGEVLKIALRHSLREARKLVKAFSEDWPGKYLIRRAARVPAEFPRRASGQAIATR